MHRRVSILALSAVTGAAALFLLAGNDEVTAQAKKQRDFVIAGSEGYGTQECLTSQSQCGRIVADAWCEAKGFKAALAYRQLDRDEITGSTNARTPSGKPVESFLISCRD
ncbi:MAG: hypothetical protein LCH38_06745 [Proteobacteria bacterium]|nr:hypothetical protein [Pseudomonadota bacterium]